MLAWLLKIHRDRVIRMEGSLHEGKSLGEVFSLKSAPVQHQFWAPDANHHVFARGRWAKPIADCLQMLHLVRCDKAHAL